MLADSFHQRRIRGAVRRLGSLPVERRQAVPSGVSHYQPRCAAQFCLIVPIVAAGQPHAAVPHRQQAQRLEHPDGQLKVFVEPVVGRCKIATSCLQRNARRQATRLSASRGSGGPSGHRPACLPGRTGRGRLAAARSLPQEGQRAPSPGRPRGRPPADGREALHEVAAGPHHSRRGAGRPVTDDLAAEDGGAPRDMSTRLMRSSVASFC